MWSEPLEFGKLTWPEVARAAREKRVPIVPIGTLEDHGRHLPIDTDVVLVRGGVQARRRASARRDRAAAADHHPWVHAHHLEFPGPNSIGSDTFVRYCTDIGTSRWRDGFKRDPGT